MGKGRGGARTGAQAAASQAGRGVQDPGTAAGLEDGGGGGWLMGIYCSCVWDLGEATGKGLTRLSDGHFCLPGVGTGGVAFCIFFFFCTSLTEALMMGSSCSNRQQFSSGFDCLLV